MKIIAWKRADFKFVPFLSLGLITSPQLRENHYWNHNNLNLGRWKWVLSAHFVLAVLWAPKSFSVFIMCTISPQPWGEKTANSKPARVPLLCSVGQVVERKDSNHLLVFVGIENESSPFLLTPMAIKQCGRWPLNRSHWNFKDGPNKYLQNKVRLSKIKIKNQVFKEERWLKVPGLQFN